MVVPTIFETCAPRTDVLDEAIAEVGDWIVECATGAELLARLGPARKR